MSFGPAVFTIRPYKANYESENISTSINSIELCFEYDIDETKTYLLHGRLETSLVLPSLPGVSPSE